MYLIFRVPRSKIFLVNAALGMGLPWIVLSFLIVVLSILFMIGKESACCSLGRITGRFINNRKSKRNSADYTLLFLAVAVIEIPLAIIITTRTYQFLGYFLLVLSLPFVVYLGISVI